MAQMRRHRSQRRTDGDRVLAERWPHGREQASADTGALRLRRDEQRRDVAPFADLDQAIDAASVRVDEHRVVAVHALGERGRRRDGRERRDALLAQRRGDRRHEGAHAQLRDRVQIVRAQRTHRHVLPCVAALGAGREVTGACVAISATTQSMNTRSLALTWRLGG